MITSRSSEPLFFVGKGDDSLETADECLNRVREVLGDYVRKRVPVTAGPGNGQGRKPKWNNMPTVAIRVPAVFADRLLAAAREWDTPEADLVRSQVRLAPALIATYEGGKGQDGVYQRIINQMPPHDIYIEPFIGGGAVMKFKRLARRSIAIDRDPEVVAAWKNIELPGLDVQCGDAVRFLSRYSWTGNELVYCDPPYLGSTRSQQGKIYRYEMMGEDEHMNLLRIIKHIPARVIISGYWSPLYAEELKGWRTLSFQAVTRSGEVVTEYLWMNYPPPLELHDYGYLGANFRERERIKRKRQRWERRLRGMSQLEAHAIAAAIETVREERRSLVTTGHTVGAVSARTSSDTG
jgi:DNA adenine methylase